MRRVDNNKQVTCNGGFSISISQPGEERDDSRINSDPQKHHDIGWSILLCKGFDRQRTCRAYMPDDTTQQEPAAEDVVDQITHPSTIRLSGSSGPDQPCRADGHYFPVDNQC